MTFWKNKNVLITGGGGFLGSHVVEQLKDKHPESITIIRQKDYDLTEQSSVRQCFQDHDVDILIHLAGYVGGIGANKEYPSDFLYKNLVMNTLVIEEAHRAKVQKIVATGAGCGYPENKPNPLKETDFWDGFPQKESAPYSLAKRMLLIQSDAYWTQHQLPMIVIIPGNIYGPYDNFDLEASHVIPALVRKFVEATDENKPSVTIWGTGKPTRDFIYAGDAARMILQSAQQCDTPQIINVSSGQGTSIKAVAEHLTKITQFKGEIQWDTSRPEGQAERYFDLSKAQDILDYRQEVDLETGLELTINWYRKNKKNARNTVHYTS